MTERQKQNFILAGFVVALTLAFMGATNSWKRDHEAALHKPACPCGERRCGR